MSRLRKIKILWLSKILDSSLYITLPIKVKRHTQGHQFLTRKAYSGTLTRREIVRVNASLGELRRDKEKLSLPISCELRRVKAS